MLGLRTAERGRRAVVLTIDPARCLAQARGRRSWWWPRRSGTRCGKRRTSWNGWPPDACPWRGPCSTGATPVTRRGSAPGARSRRRRHWTADTPVSAPTSTPGIPPRTAWTRGARGRLRRGTAGTAPSLKPFPLPKWAPPPRSTFRSRKNLPPQPQPQPQPQSAERSAERLAARLLRVRAGRMRRLAHEERTRARFTAVHPEAPVARVAALPGDVHDLARLRAVGERLAAGP